MWERVLRRRDPDPVPEPPPEPLRDVEPALITKPPSPQNALDVFKGEWISAPPPELSGLTAGEMPLFEDPRVDWALSALGGVSGARVLELGPMEGGHSYMLQRRGAREVVAIEGNQRCFLKCLVTKEVAGLDRVRYLLGDFIEYMRTTSERFDMVLASGVLYHMADPVEVVHLVSRVADRAYFWTHYYDERVRETVSAPHFSGPHAQWHGDFVCRGLRYEYNLDSRHAKYAGGLASHAHWLPREDLMRVLAHAGFTRVQIGFDDAQHVHGPALALACGKD